MIRGCIATLCVCAVLADEWACSMDRAALQAWLRRVGAPHGTRDALDGLDGADLCGIDDDALFRDLFGGGDE